MIRALLGPIEPVPPQGLPEEPRQVPGGHDHQLLWFALADHHLASVALVAADPSVSLERVGEIAHGLADVGQRIVDLPVTAIVMDTNDESLVFRVSAVLGATREATTTQKSGSPLAVIVAMPSVLSEPAGLAVAHAADGVVLCAALGATYLEQARRSMDLIGGSRVVGCIVV